MTSTFPRWAQDHRPSFVYELSQRLADYFQVHILAPHSHGAKTRETLGGVEVHRFRYWPTDSTPFGEEAILPSLRKSLRARAFVPLFVIAEFVSMVKLLRGYRIGVVHAHWIIPQGLLAVLYKRVFAPHLKVVVTSHGADIFGLSRLRPVKRWVLSHCTAVTVVSNALRDAVNAMHVRNLSSLAVAPMGVDLSHFSPDKYEERIKEEHSVRGPFLLFVGRLTAKKGLDYLLRAMPEITRTHPEVKLLIIGYGEEEARLKELSADLQMGDNVLFLGPMTNAQLPAYYATADVFIGPSICSEDGDQEGFGLVFAEAMACNCVPVATDLPAIADIIKHGENGLIVKQKDSAAISSAVLLLLANEERFHQLRRNCRSSVLRKFDWVTITERYRNVLTDCQHSRWYDQR